jgi:hypothetical protein
MLAVQLRKFFNSVIHNWICFVGLYYLLIIIIIRLAPKAYFTFYISQISSLPEIPCSQ